MLLEYWAEVVDVDRRYASLSHQSIRYSSRVVAWTSPADVDRQFLRSSSASVASLNCHCFTRSDKSLIRSSKILWSDCYSRTPNQCRQSATEDRQRDTASFNTTTGWHRCYPATKTCHPVTEIFGPLGEKLPSVQHSVINKHHRLSSIISCMYRPEYCSHFTTVHRTTSCSPDLSRLGKTIIV